MVEFAKIDSETGQSAIGPVQAIVLRLILGVKADLRPRQHFSRALPERSTSLSNNLKWLALRQESSEIEKL